MKYSMTILCVLVPLLLAAPAATAGGAAHRAPVDIVPEHSGFPPALYSDLPGYDPSYPRWVAADAILNEDGTINEKLVHPANIDLLRDHLSIPPVDGCIRLEEFYDDLVVRADISTFAKRVHHAAMILHATVTDFTYGFKGTTPGRLLRLEPLDVLKGRETPLDDYFVFYPVGTFEVGDHKICKTDFRYPEIPEPGDEIVLVVPDRPNSKAQLLEPDLGGPENYFLLGPTGVRASSRFQPSSEPLSAQDFLHHISTLVEGDDH
jgi:hypothetical protein